MDITFALIAVLFLWMTVLACMCAGLENIPDKNLIHKKYGGQI